MSDHEGLTRFQGLCVCVNLLMGSGFLSLPSAFVDTGMVFGACLLSVGTFLLITTALFEAESIIRATACKQFGGDALELGAGDDRASINQQTASTDAKPVVGDVGEDDLANALISRQLEGNLSAPTRSPEATREILRQPLEMQLRVISANRTLEITEVCELLVGPRMKAFYCTCLSLYQLGTLWSYASVFGEAVASVVPLPGFNGGSTCDIYDADNATSCLSLYRAWVGVFTLIGVPLSLLDVREQAGFQVAMTFIRIAIAGVMVLTCIVASATDADREATWGEEGVDRGHVPNWKFGGVFGSFSIVVFAELLNASMGILSGALASKSDLGVVVTGGMGITAVGYMIIALAVGSYFGLAVDDSSNVNWRQYNIKPIRWLVVGFPALDVLSVFPMNVIISANNLMALWYGDSARVSEALASPMLRAAWRVGVALPSIVLALFWYKLDQILAFTGVIGMLIAFAIPSLLYPLSRRMCQKCFGANAPLAGPLFINSWLGSDQRVSWGIALFGGAMAILTLIDTVLIYVTGHDSVL